MMKTWRLFFYLSLAVVTVPLAHSQNIVQSFPTVGGSIPNPCNTINNPPYGFTLTGTSSWGQYCSNIRVGPLGTVSGTGTGACPTSFGSLAPCPDPSGALAPTFASTPTAQLNGATWVIYETIGNASLQPVPGGGLPNLYYACAAPMYTQATATTPLAICPAPCPPKRPGCSPIVIDPTGEGFFLTDKAHGVHFRTTSESALQEMSWTDPAHHNAWLVRPNADGSVSSLEANMFGNLSPQPASDEPNGYAALGFWAQEQGCGKVTHLDATTCPVVWGELRLWQDGNQDGVAQPEELHTLEALGVHGISLQYREKAWVDQYGNQFRYVSQVDEAAGENERSYDVFLIF